MLLCFQCCSVESPGEILCDVDTQELDALLSSTVDVQRSMQGVLSPEVHNSLFYLLHIQTDIIVTAPHGKAVHLIPMMKMNLTL